ncbi:MAG: hypothetical protein CMJ64_16400 [Planctomycetaceae bacterium]|nr:hypothetical protein [Planctomycetaceae bacterium]
MHVVCDPAVWRRVQPTFHRHESTRLLRCLAYLGTRLHRLSSHVHFVVPGGGISTDDTHWLASPDNFLIPAQAASVMYRAKFRDALKADGCRPS